VSKRKSASSVPHVAVTMHAILHVTAIDLGQQCVDEITMTINACALRHAAVSWFDLDRVAVAAQRERQRVKETVIRFGDPFPDVIVRQMTVVADRDVVMTALLPRIKMGLHDVTVDAGLWLVAQVAGTVAVTECEATGSG